MKSCVVLGMMLAMTLAGLAVVCCIVSVTSALSNDTSTSNPYGEGGEKWLHMDRLTTVYGQVDSVESSSYYVSRIQIDDNTRVYAYPIILHFTDGRTFECYVVRGKMASPQYLFKGGKYYQIEYDRETKCVNTITQFDAPEERNIDL